MAIRQTVPYAQFFEQTLATAPAKEQARTGASRSRSRAQRARTKAEAKDRGKESTFNDACHALRERMPEGYSLEALREVDPKLATQIERAEALLDQVWRDGSFGDFRKTLEAWYRLHLTGFASVLNARD